MFTQPSNINAILREITVRKAWVSAMENRDTFNSMSRVARNFVSRQMYENKKLIIELTVLVSEIQMRQQLSRLNISKWTATLRGAE
jgi:hypothetical protein